MRLYDDRYVGNHGIGRFAREVTAGLPAEWRPAGFHGNPTSPRDSANLRRLRLPSDTVLYSPGFGTGPSRCTQILTVHDLIHLRCGSGAKATLQRQWYDRVLRPVVRRAGHVMTVSATSAHDLREWLGDDVQVQNVGNGCSSAFTREGPRQVDAQPYVLYVGNLKEHKNADVAFAAVARTDGVRLRVVCADADGVDRLARTHGIADRVVRESGVDDARLAKLYRGAEALVFPSTWEGFGLPALEALRCGTQVIYDVACESVSEICGPAGLAYSRHHAVSEAADLISQCLDARGQLLTAPGLEQYDWDRVRLKVAETLTSIA